MEKEEMKKDEDAQKSGGLSPRIKLTAKEKAVGRELSKVLKEHCGLKEPFALNKKDYQEIEHSMINCKGELCAKANSKLDEKELGSGEFGKVKLVQTDDGRFYKVKIIEEIVHSGGQIFTQKWTEFFNKPEVAIS